MSEEFRRDYLVRLPLPLAQLYSRAFNASHGRSLHDNAYYLFETLIKLGASVAAAAYVDTGPRTASIDRLLDALRRPLISDWLALFLSLAEHFDGSTANQGPDGPTPPPLGHLWAHLKRPRREPSDLLSLYRRIKNGPDGPPSPDSRSCTALEVLNCLVSYRNKVLGHGAVRADAFYGVELGPLLLRAAGELLAEGELDVIGPRGSRLVALSGVRTTDDGRTEVDLRELIGMKGERAGALVCDPRVASTFRPNQVAVIWPGRALPLRLDPFLGFREGDLTDEVVFLNGVRKGGLAEYLGHSTGQTVREHVSEGDLVRLFSGKAGREADRGEIPEFHILGQIGRGGMGVVHLARQCSLERLVALKTLAPEADAAGAALDRFNREMRLLARCEHPNVVKVLASGTLPDGRLYYAMEYIPGCDLDAVWRELAATAGAARPTTLGAGEWTRAVTAACRKNAAPSAEPPPDPVPGPPTPDDDQPGGYVRRVVGLVRETSLALEAVHGRQVVHRDVKPSNLMVTPDGARIVLLDFGLAKLQEAERTDSLPADALRLSLRYAAPEQLEVQGKKGRVGPATDVRALGITLWELLTLRRLFAEAEDVRSLAACILNRPVPGLREADPGFDPDVAAVVAAATEREPADRLPTAAKLADYLGLYLDGKPLPIRPPSAVELAVRWARAHRPAVVAAALAAAAVVLTVVAAFLVVDRRRREAEWLSARLALDRGQSLCARQQVDLGMLYMARGLELAPADRPAFGEAVRANLNAWSGQFLHHGGQIGCDGPVHAAAFGPGGTVVAVAGLDGIVRVAEAATSRVVHALEHGGSVECLAFSPDGRRLVSGGFDGTVRFWDAGQGRLLFTSRHGGPVRQVAFSPDGATVLTASDDGRATLRDPVDGRALRSFTHAGPVYAAAFSPDSRLVATGSADNTAKVWDVKGAERHTSRFHGAVKSLAFSHDGRHLAVGTDEPGGEHRDGYLGSPRLIELEGFKSVSLSYSGAVHVLAFSPDDRLLAVTGPQPIVTVLNVGQPGAAPLSLTHGDTVTAVAFGPDGRTVVTGSRSGELGLWRVTDGRLAAPMLTFQEAVMVLAVPPGRETVLVGGASLGARLLRPWANPTAPPTVLGQADDDPVGALAFSPSGHLLVTGHEATAAYVSSGGHDAARVWNADGGALVRTLRRDDRDRTRVSAVAFSRDGDWIATGHVVLDERDSALTAVAVETRLWRARDGALERAFPHRMGYGNAVTALAFSPDGRLLLAGDSSGALSLLERGARREPAGGRSGQAAHVLPTGVVAVGFNPDGAGVSVSRDRTVHVWDLSGGVLGLPVRSVVVPGRVLGLSADGGCVVTQVDLRSVRVWTTSGGVPVGGPLVQDAEVHAATVSHDGRMVCVGFGEGQAQLWSLADGVKIGPPLSEENDPALVRGLVFSPDGSAVAAGHASGVARVWAIPRPLAGDPVKVRLWCQLITGKALDTSEEPYELDAASWLSCRDTLYGAAPPAREAAVTGQ
jgi:WD40 repeat protein/serine/threonine protein kinase